MTFKSQIYAEFSDYLNTYYTIDWEIFTLKIICVKNFHVDKFSWFVRSIKFFCVKCFYSCAKFSQLVSCNCKISLTVKFFRSTVSQCCRPNPLPQKKGTVWRTAYTSCVPLEYQLDGFQTITSCGVSTLPEKYSQSASIVAKRCLRYFSPFSILLLLLKQ